MQVLARLCAFLELEVLFHAHIFVGRVELIVAIELRLLFTSWLVHLGTGPILSS